MRSLLCSTVMLMLATGAAWAQTPRLEDATIVGKGGQLSIVRLPIEINGQTVYRDITLDLKVNAKGDVSIFTNATQPSGGVAPAVAAVAAAPVIVSKPSAPPVVQNYRSGTYRAADGTAYHLANHGVPYGGELPEWQLTVIGTGGRVLDSATWYDGAIDKSPLRKRLRNAGISSEAMSWGATDSGSGTGFDDGALIGVAAAGNVLTIYSFHKGCCTDTAEARHVLSFELVATD